MSETPEACPKTGRDHIWQALGRRDDGTWAHRCGMCECNGTSEEEGGDPVPVRVNGKDAAAVSAERVN